MGFQTIDNHGQAPIKGQSLFIKLVQGPIPVQYVNCTKMANSTLVLSKDMHEDGGKALLDGIWLPVSVGPFSCQFFQIIAFQQNRPQNSFLPLVLSLHIHMDDREALFNCIWVSVRVGRFLSIFLLFKISPQHSY